MVAAVISEEKHGGMCASFETDSPDGREFQGWTSLQTHYCRPESANIPIR